MTEHDVFVSGRLCLFGEHSDWAGAYHEQNQSIPEGTTIVVGTQEGLYARARALDKPVFSMMSTLEDGVTKQVEILFEETAMLEEAQKGDFFSYAAGTAYQMLRHYGGRVHGLMIHNYRSTLPMAKGLSSSAAICVLVARAYSAVYGLQLTVREEMELGYQGEIVTPSKCGRMDQACAYGSMPVVMKFKGAQLVVEDAKLSVPLPLVLVDLRAQKDTVRILTALQEAYPEPKNADQERMQELLGHVNNSIVARVLQAMAKGDAQAVGSLMCEAQREFDARAGPLCPDQLTAPVLHKVLTYPALQPHIWGGKGIGSQGDGTAQLLCKGPEEQAKVCQIVQEELQKLAMPLTVRANVSK
ncbi:ribosomal protein S5 domain 2-type protein [Dunaliella salina]|uniref:Ribosomal protein S5 domain 2-type protein n=1 Tax=Dunaliella salina TaxID=3046 RepID=A0ABQ7GTD0_DUNSA|nr:ribosomal protein S5 domain 2-type protein [Dunaliella salina]|eukprot:KAF5837866.1 ribosomal protein S5 domain 2-type protein [Dunaliella salina]